MAIGLALWLLISWIKGFSIGFRDEKYPIPDKVHISQCIEGEAWNGHLTTHGKYPYAAHKSFELPLSSDVLFLLSRGALSTGSVEISTLPLLSDTVRVDVEVLYYSQDVLEHTEVCKLKRSRREHGVGFFTPRSWTSIGTTDRPFFNVKVYFPEGVGRTLKVNNFETDLPNFSHVLGDLHERVHLNTLSLAASNGGITGETLSFGTGSLRTSNADIQLSVVAEEADIRTRNGAIEGRYVSSGDLALKTSNGHIRAIVEFGNAKRLSVLDVTTSNAFIETDITAHGAKSTVTVRTSNGHLAANIVDIPVDSALTLDARTSNSEAYLFLPPTYEGTFHLSTSDSQPRLKNGQSDVEDPKGEGRQRSAVTRMTSKGISAGNIFWDENAMDRGSVKLSTSNGPAILKI